VPGETASAVTLPPLPKDASQILPPTGFGQVTLLEMLGDQIGFSPAWSAVQGWMGDQFVSYRQNGQVCVALSVLDDNPTSAAALTRAARAWASHLTSASASQSGKTVDFQACDPGPAWRPSTHVADPYQALAVRSVILYQLITDGQLPATAATCATDQLMTTIGPQKLQDAEQSSDPNSPADQTLRSALPRAVANCA
jgi:hypothetical protein